MGDLSLSFADWIEPRSAGVEEASLEDQVIEKARDEYLHRRNVANYRRLLRESAAGGRRDVLITLLAEEAARARVKGWSSPGD